MTVLLAALLALAPSAYAASEFAAALRRAEARDAGDPERVEFATRAIRAWLPADGRLLLSHAHLRRAEGLLRRREHAAAAEDLAKVLENDPGNQRALLLKGDALLAAGRALDAERDLSAYTASRPEDAEGWLGLARARLPDSGAGRPAEARKAAARARRLAPGDWRPDWLEGRSWLRERRPDAALEPLTRAAALAKGAPEPHAERAAALAALGRHAEAVEEWSRALPPLERARVEAERAGAAAKAGVEARAALAEAHVSRARLRGFLLDAAGARGDYDAACALGRADACERLNAAPAAAAPAARRRAPAPALDAPEETPRPRKRRPVRQDAGERIYAN